LKKIEIIVLLSVLLLSTITILLALIRNMNDSLTVFEKKATEALGTDDYIIEMGDMVIAKTKDGRQYPSQEAVDAYYRSKMVFYLGGFGFVILFSVGFLVIASWQNFEIGIKLYFGILRSWMYILTDTFLSAPPYCPHIKERMVCRFCPNHACMEMKK